MIKFIKRMFVSKEVKWIVNNVNLSCIELHSVFHIPWNIHKMSINLGNGQKIHVEKFESNRSGYCDYECSEYWMCEEDKEYLFEELKHRLDISTGNTKKDLKDNGKRNFREKVGMN